MSRRTQLFQQVPWTGGLNTAEDSGFTPANDLVIAENVVFTNTGARIKREGLSYFDHDIPVPNARASSGTTRTLYFDTTGGTNDCSTATDKLLVVGERITITSSGSGNDATYAATDVVITAVTVSGDGHYITYTDSGSLTETKTSTTTITVTRASSIVELKDYWYFNTSNVKTQLLMAATDDFQLFSYDSNGNRTLISAESSPAATIPAGVCSSLNSVVFNNQYILCFPALTEKPVRYNPDTDADYQLLANAPDASLMVEYLGRLWSNDKTNPDRVQYSETGDHEVWGGTGDSGAIDVANGDGDSAGITALFPYKGMLIVCKKNRYFRILGDSPENFVIQPVSYSTGCESAKGAVAVDTADGVIFVSNRGIHSIEATDTYGDIDRSYLSAKIQRTYVEDINRSRLSSIQTAYIPTLNSVVFAISNTGESSNNTLLFYNTDIKEWYTWPGISCTALAKRDISTLEKLIVGTSNGRVITAQNGDYTDFGSSSYQYKIKTPTIYPNNDLANMKGFKRLYLLLKPKNQFTLTVKVKVDNLPRQSNTILQEASGDTLGGTFVLGSSALGISGVINQFSMPIEGYGKGLTIEVTNGSTEEQVTIYGFMIEYDVVDITPEIITG